jgi:hypothetical protein
MSRGFFAAVSTGAVLTASLAATEPMYFNSGYENTSPRIDATAFVNEGTFVAGGGGGGGFGGFIFFGGQDLFDTGNTLYYTNLNSGVIQAGSGFDFSYNTPTRRLPADSVVNYGTVDVGTYLLINATNVVNTGVLGASSSGLIRITGQNVDLNRGAVKTGDAAGTTPLSPSPAFQGVDQSGVEYNAENGVTELTWGAGANGALGGTAAGGQNTFNAPQDVSALTTPRPRTQPHQVLVDNAGPTNTVTLSQFSFSGYRAYAQTNTISPTNLLVQVVFVPTNHTDTNFSYDVRFANSLDPQPDFPQAKVVTVQFGLRDVDPITAQTFTNLVYFVDRSATTTNFTIITNAGNTNIGRPFPHVVTRRLPTEWTTGTTNNAVFTNSLLFSPAYSNQFVTNAYVASSASVGSAPGSFSVGGNATDPTSLALNDPTNQPGRIEITADKLDLGFFRLRSEGLVSIRAKEYVGNAPSQVDAPFITYDLGTTNDNLVVTNLLKDQVVRFAGTIAAWSGFWTNQTGMVVTNADTNIPPVTNVIDIITTVLVVDRSFQTTYPVEMTDLVLRAKNVELADNFNLNRNFSIDGETLTVVKSLQFGGTLSNWVGTNFSRVHSLTNLGTINLPGQLNFGGDRPTGMVSFVNRGRITSRAQVYRSDSIENWGVLDANNGTLNMLATAIKLDTSTNRALGDVRLTATDLKVRNSLVRAGNRTTNGNGTINYSRGALHLTVTGSLSDGGAGASNRLSTLDGFRLMSKPLAGDLLGTQLETVAAPFGRVDHVWAGEDRGPTAAGYENNTAIGRLVIEGNLNSLHNFTGASANNALYVDFLDLRNGATNVDAALSIASNLKIYFAAANLPVEQLDGKFNGRLRWAKSFAGPNSTTNLTLANGQKLSVNLSLFNSLTADSDGDGLVNGRDPSPFDGVVVSKVGITNVPPLSAAITFPAAANTIYYVDYLAALGTTNWINLLSLTNTAATNVVKTVTDPLPADGSQRFYRVRYLP